MDARLNVNTSSSVLGPAATPAAESQGEGFGAALASASQQQSGDNAASSQAPVAAESSATDPGGKSPSPTSDEKAKPAAADTADKANDAKPKATDDTDNGKEAKAPDGETVAKSGKVPLNAANPLQPGRQQPASAGADDDGAVEGGAPAEVKDMVASDDTTQPEHTKVTPPVLTETGSQGDDDGAWASVNAGDIQIETSDPTDARTVPGAAGVTPDTQPSDTEGQGGKETGATVTAKTVERGSGFEAEADSAPQADTNPAPFAKESGTGTVTGVTEASPSPSPFAGLGQTVSTQASTQPSGDESGDQAPIQAAVTSGKTTEPQSVATAAQPLVSRPTQAAKVAGEGAQAASGVDSSAVTQAKGDAAAGSGDGDASGSGDKANGELLAQLQGLKQAQDKLSSAPKGRMAALTTAAEGSTTATATPSQPISTDADADPLAKWANELVKADSGTVAGRTTATLASDGTLPMPETQLANSTAAVEAAEAAELDLDPQLRMQQARTPEARIQAHQQLQQDPAAALRQPVAAERMAPELRERMMMMINSRTSQAEIRLDPPELGALQVKIQMNGDQAQVQMHAAQAQTREMVEQALPRLREMLAQQGITLADTHISHGGGGQAGNETGDGQGQHGQQGFGDGMVEASDETLATVQQMTGRNADGGIDYYA